MIVLPLLLGSLLNMVAQAPPGTMPMQQPLENGACLDSPRAVPKALLSPPSRPLQIVRIDQVISTATMTPGEIIGFLYTTQDGSTWLGERTAEYMSPAGATAVNLVLGATHVPSETATEFPPESRYGVATKYREYFRVHIPPQAFDVLKVQVVPCVAWPGSRPLPDPVM